MTRSVDFSRGWANPPSFPRTTEAAKIRADEAGYSPAQRAQAAFQRALTAKAAEPDGLQHIMKAGSKLVLNY